jgi:hypothetical protein
MPAEELRAEARQGLPDGLWGPQGPSASAGATIRGGLLPWIV